MRKPIIDDIEIQPQLMQIKYPDERVCNYSNISRAKMPEFRRRIKYKQETYIDILQPEESEAY